MTGKETTDRAKTDSAKPLRGLIPFLLPQKWLAAKAGCALLAAAAFTLLLPFALRRVIDSGFSGANSDDIDGYFLSLFAVAAALALATALRYLFVTRLGEQVIADIRCAVFQHMLGMGPDFFEKLRVGEAISRLTADTEIIQSALGSIASFAIRNALLMVGALLLMIANSPKLAGFTLAIGVVVVVPIVVMGRRVRVFSRESLDRVADTSAIANETLTQMRIVQAFTREESEYNRFQLAINATLVAAGKRIGARSVLSFVVIVLVFFGVVGVLWAGAHDVLAGRMSTGELAQFLVYAVVVAGAAGSLSDIWGEILRTAGATERLLEILAAENSIRSPTKPKKFSKKITGDISFEEVRFHYPSRPDYPALDDFSLQIKAGETMALVGPSGSGKSTLFQLLLRFYDPDAGRVLMEGIDLRDLSLVDLRRQMALVPQEPAIFADSAAANIGMARPGASMDDVEQAARAADAHEFIMQLPKGYESPLGERGVMLSGGQKQRIAIARALLRDAPILLLDEATSSLDAESERAVQEAFALMSENRTSLVIAHRLATVKRADRIVVMDAGKIVAQGSHESLVKQDGLYARLAALQFGENN